MHACLHAARRGAVCMHSRQLLLAVEAVAEVDAADAAVGVYLHAQGLDVVGACRGGAERADSLEP